jgi:methionyl-tRNA synthetase
MLNAIELIEPRCSTCNSQPAPRTTRHLFLDLPKLQPALQDFVTRQIAEGTWTPNAVQITEALLRCVPQRCPARCAHR